MAFTRKALKAMGLSDEQIDSIIELHIESTDAIKADRDKYKEDAEKLPDVQRQLDEANSKISAAEKDDYKGKYESEKAAHDKHKADIATKETAANRLKSFKDEAKKRGYSDNAIKHYLDSKAHDPMERIKYDDEGKATNFDDVFKGLDEAFPELKVNVTKVTHTPNVPNQTATGGEKKTTSRAAQIWEKAMKSMYGDNAVNSADANNNNSSGKEN
jgi:hypothetical protein